MKENINEYIAASFGVGLVIGLIVGIALTAALIYTDRVRKALKNDSDKYYLN